MLAKSISYAEKLLGDDYDYSGFEIAAKVYDGLYVENNDAAMEKKFIDKFYRGFMDRPSVKKSLPTKTVFDYSTDSILSALIPEIDVNMLNLIRYGHKISMAADSIIGMMLDEYIHINLRPYGWTCCWGNAMQGVDVCSSSGDMIHVRNKSNTEVSNNDRNRTQQSVKKWFRINAYTGKTKWDDLNLLVGKIDLFSEDGFRDFVYDITRRNPSCLYTGEEDVLSLSSAISNCKGQA